MLIWSLDPKIPRREILTTANNPYKSPFEHHVINTYFNKIR